MITPKNYELSPKVTVDKLQHAPYKFRGRKSTYWLKRELYENFVYLSMEIDVSAKTMIFEVHDKSGEPYSPFYREEERHNHIVCESIIKKFNNTMDALVRAKILKYEEEVNPMNTETIKILYHADIEKIEMRDGGDWIDLRAAEDVKLKKGDFKLINLGVSMQLPAGYEAHMVPRSSTYKQFGIIQTNHQAVIDESYCGTNDIWRYPAYALRDTEIKKNDRICQFRIVKKQPQILFEQVNELSNKDRGGIGSTGKN